MHETIEKILPIIIFFMLGRSFKTSNWITSEGMANIKKMVMSLALPSVLFLTFLDMEFQKEYLIIVVLTMVLLALMMFVGRLWNFVPFFHNKYNPFFSTGYAFGLVGVALFSIMFGEENMAIYSVIGLAHELFVWVFYFGILKVSLFDTKLNVKEILKLLSTPIMFSIFFGVIANFLNFNTVLGNNGLWNGFVSTVEYMSNISTPLILLSIGYGINISVTNISATLKLMFVKVMTIIIVAIPFKIFVVDKLIEPTYWLDVSYVALALLPPIFAFPVFIADKATEEDLEIVSNAVAIYTVISMTVFVLYAILIA